MRTIGEMLEWLKRHAWKACGLLKGLASSNLALSASLFEKQVVNNLRTDVRTVLAASVRFFMQYSGTNHLRLFRQVQWQRNVLPTKPSGTKKRNPQKVRIPLPIINEIITVR